MELRSPRLSRRRFLALGAAAGAATSLPLPRAWAADDCHPMTTPREFLGLVPTPDEILGFRLGFDREVTTAESDAVLDAIAGASDRVVVDTLATSVQGRPIRYAVVGSPEHVTPAGLEAVRQAHLRIRDPRTSRGEVAELAGSTPVFLWVGGTIHGNEESGADAALEVVHGLADRDDCVVNRILRNAVVFVVPVQNPDGRERDIRRNHYAFDLNRDYLSRTQPETDGKVELMRRYPPLLFLDHHEFGFYRSFFPPNDDPVYHEVTDEVLHWINDIYGPAIAAEFERRGWDYFNRGQGYDFFAPIFTDTLTSFGFQGTGMTIEIYNGAPIRKRFVRQRSVMWVTLAAAAARKERIFRSWHRSFVEAVEEGTRGELQRNVVFEEPYEVRVQPPTAPLRHYFIRDDDPEKARETALLVRALQRMDVEVYRLRSPLRVPDFHPHRESGRAATLPAGTYWIPMAQPQKHWIQAAMNEDAYQPIDRAYGLTGFSLALLSGAECGWSGAVLSPDAERAPEVGPVGPPSLPGSVPTIKVFQASGGVFAWEGTRWLQHLFDNVWGVPYQRVRGDDIKRGALDGADVLIMPSGGVDAALKHLRKPGQEAIVDLVNGGGRMIGWRWGGARLAWVLGLSAVKVRDIGGSIRDILLRVALDEGSPLADGVGPSYWVAHDGDYFMVNDPPGVVARFPTHESGDFSVNGFPGGTRILPGRGVLADELVGGGRVITSSHELNYRAETIGAQRVLWNAIFGPDPVAAARRGPVTYDEQAVARRAATLEPDDLPSAITVTVAKDDASEAKRVLDGYGVRVRRLPSDEGVRFALANPDELSAEEHPFAAAIPAELTSRGIEVLAFRAPS